MSNGKEQPVVITTEDATAVLKAERDQRVLECGQEIEAVLSKHNCSLDATITLSRGQVIPQIIVAANQ